MKRKMEYIRNGKFEFEVPRLIFSQDEIHVCLPPGEKMQGELSFTTEEEVKIKGYVVTSCRRFVPSVEKFSGTSIEFAYGIDGGGMKQGEVCTGKLSLLTNLGEYHIPYTIEAKIPQLATSIGEVKDLLSFVRLAETNYREAFRLFTHPGFAALLPEDQKLYALYRGMSANPVTYQHLEEFFIGAGLKSPVKLSLKDTKAGFFQVKESMRDSLVIFRSGWGHIDLRVETKGDFIQVMKNRISDEDFIGSTYRLDFVVLREKLGKGKHFGKILIRGPYETMEYSVTASSGAEDAGSQRLQEKKDKLAIWRCFKEYQMGETALSDFTQNMEQLLEKKRVRGMADAADDMMTAYLLHENNKDGAAREILLRYKEKSFGRQEQEAKAVYLYLCYKTELFRDRWSLAEKLQRLYRQREDSYLLLWLLMQADEEYRGSALRSLHALEHQYAIGCRSPFLYYETYHLVAEHLNLLDRMSPFFTQVMLFAASSRLLTEEISMRIAYLSGYEKNFSESLYRTLALAYESFPSEDTLEAICRMIMMDDVSRKRYFRWFELAVEQNLHLTRLYECYIESMDENHQKLLPRAVRRYFVYNNALSDSKKAFVYANVIRHKAEDPEVYDSYRPVILSFGKKKLKEKAMNEDYAVIYQELAREDFGQELKDALAEVIFTRRLYCDDEKIRNIIVCHAQFEKEEVYPCVKGRAYPRIYTKDAVVLFQDYRKRRFAATVDYNMRRMFDGEILETCCRGVTGREECLLYQSCGRDGRPEITEESLDSYCRMAADREFTEAFRREIMEKLLLYYREHLMDARTEKKLADMDYAAYASVDKKLLMELLIDRGLMEEAFAILTEMGEEEVEPAALLKLCSRMILFHEFAQDEELLCLAWKVFSGGLYDEVLLNYLMMYYTGPVKQMIDVWEAAEGFELDTYRLEEKILAHLIFVDDYSQSGIDVLAHYVEQKGQSDRIAAYLSFLSFGYFVHGYPIAEYGWKALKKALADQWELPLVCRASLLKYYSQRSQWTKSERKQIRSLMEECVQQGLYYDFYEKLPAEVLTAFQLDDKIFVQYHSVPDEKVILYYALDTGLGKGLEYKSEPVRGDFYGCYVKSFTLFYGETLHYYFQVEDSCGTHYTEESMKTASVSEEKTQTRYQMINQILKARKTDRQQEAMRKLRHYRQQERMARKLFQIEKGQKYE